MAGTIRQIAQIAGVSRGTVDRALNHRGRINPEVAERIWKIAEELDYHPGKRKTSEENSTEELKIGVITQMANSSFMLQIHQGIRDIERELKERGVTLCVCDLVSVDEMEQLKAIDQLDDQKIAALAIMPVESEQVRRRLNRLMEEKGIPVVTFNSDLVGTGRSCFVGLDNRRSGSTAAGLMGMLTRGEGKILIITGSFTNSVNSLRVEGFVGEVKHSFPDMELLGVQGSSGDPGEVEQIVVNTLEREPDLAGIFVACMGQEGVSAAFERLNLQKRPYVIVYDLTPENVDDLKKGNFDFLLDQEGYMQGYRAVRKLYDYLTRGKELQPEMMFTDIKIITRYNLP
ncbi:MAG: LacI family DNA-binding transcriptional regulator [Ruminococcus sp.]|jgi:LacI family transcriptional regulator